ncbi:CENP-S associating centromere protein X domain-containing protein [Sarocladium implicatum]|nr:CENP-S associating centromere protein X domain-containing protein [Sarocladium implicatum]
MAPKQTTNASRGRPKGSKNASKPAATRPPASSNPFASSDEEAQRSISSDEDEDNGASSRAKRASRGGDDAGAEEPEKTIPKELLTRLLHEFFAKDATRVSKDANAAVGKYMDVFVREAIARTAVEKQGGFLEVEDLEKISPQLLLDL